MWTFSWSRATSIIAARRHEHRLANILIAFELISDEGSDISACDRKRSLL
jgi:hypothetical protein